MNDPTAPEVRAELRCGRCGHVMPDTYDSDCDRCHSGDLVPIQPTVEPASARERPHERAMRTWLRAALTPNGALTGERLLDEALAEARAALEPERGADR